jgi:hypothetical protein
VRAQAGELQAAAATSAPTPAIYVWLAWLAIGIPLAWGVYRTLKTAAKLFS